MPIRDGADGEGFLEPGLYRHFKGKEYRLLSVARHSETEELLAVYVTVQEPDRVWVRPASMFTETVEVDGKIRPRFEPTPLAAATPGRRRSPLRAFAGWLERAAGQLAEGPEDRGHLHGGARPL